MLAYGHRLVSEAALGELGELQFKFGCNPRDIAQACVDTDAYHYIDNFCHFMKASADDTTANVVTSCRKYLRYLTLAACHWVVEQRASDKNCPRELRNGVRPATLGTHGPQGRWGFYSQMSGWSTALQQGNAAAVIEMLNLTQSNTERIAYAIGFSLHAVQDSYTPRHAERTKGYTGAIARVYCWASDRDNPLGSGALWGGDTPIKGSLCNGGVLMTHHEGDLYEHWRPDHQTAAKHACWALLRMILELTANPRADLNLEHAAYWKGFEDKYFPLQAIAGDEEDKGQGYSPPRPAKIPEPEVRRHSPRGDL